MTTPYSVGAYLIDRLKELGIGHVFGVPGDYGFPFMDRIEADRDIAWVGTCNELNGAYAADGYARSHGIAALVGSCGVLDLGAAAGVGGAYAEQVPVIVISCYPPTEAMAQQVMTHHSLRGKFDRYPRIYEQLTVAQALLSEHNPCREIDRVLTACWLESSPVYIQLPKDVVELPAEPPAANLSLPEPQSDARQLEELVERIVPVLTDAQIPVMLFDFPGAGHWRWTQLVEDFAEKIGIPFAATYAAMSAGVDGTHSMYLGTYFGASVGSAADERVDSADVLVRVCVRSWPDETNRGPAFERHGPDVIDLRPDSASIAESQYSPVALPDVLSRLGSQLSHRSSASGAQSLTVAPFEPRPATAITQDRLWEAFWGFVQQDDVVVVDAGTCAASVQTQPPVRYRRLFQYSWAAIGWSVPTLLGAHLADPDHRHIEVVGDGAFQESAQELSTVIRHGLAPIIVLLNNGHYVIENMIRDGGPGDMGYNVLQVWNYHQLPEVFAQGRNPLGLRVTTEEELQAAFVEAAQAQRERRCTLIEVVLGAHDIPHRMAAVLGAYLQAKPGHDK